MGVTIDHFGPITGYFVLAAAISSPIIAIYVQRRTKDASMKKDNCWYLLLTGD